MVPCARIPVLTGSPRCVIEVVLPTLWTLQQLPNTHVDLFRDNFRPGTREALQEWFTGGMYAYWDFVKQNMSDYKTVFLTNGDRDTAPLFKRKILEVYPHLKVVAIVHQVQRYKASDIENSMGPLVNISDLERISALVRARRWSILTLSPHVTNSLLAVLSGNPFNGSQVSPTVLTFVPVRVEPARIHSSYSEAEQMHC